MSSLREETAVCDTSETKPIAAPAAAATTTTKLALRDQSNKTKACTNCHRPSQYVLGLAGDRLATFDGDVPDVEGCKVSRSAGDSCTSALEDAEGGPNPQNRRLFEGRNGFNSCSCLDISTGIGSVLVDARREGSQGVRSKRRPTTKRRRAPRDDHVQFAARANAKTTVNVPRSPSKSPSAVDAVARQIGSSSTEGQATGPSMIPQHLDIILISKAVPNPDLKLTNATSDIAVVPGSCFLERQQSARRKDKHSIPEGPAIGLHQPPNFTLRPRAQRNKQGRWRQGKTKDSQDKDISVDIESSKKKPEGATESQKEVQDRIASSSAKTQTVRTSASDTQIVLKGPNEQGLANPDAVNGKRLNRSRLQNLKRKQKGKTYVVSEEIFDVNNSVSREALARTKQSTRGQGRSHRGRDHQKSSDNQALPNTTIPIFQSQHTPSITSSRRRRGFQPDEVNKNNDNEKLKSGRALTIQGDSKVTNLATPDQPPNISRPDDKLASIETPNPKETIAPHRRFLHSQVPEMEKKPSCWSLTSPPMAPPTEWNSTGANIDRPASTGLPVYRMPKLEVNAEGKTVKVPAAARVGALPPHLKVQSLTSRPDEKLMPHLRAISTAQTLAAEKPVSVTTPVPKSQEKDEGYRSMIDIDAETAVSQPVLDIDEEVVAGLRAETSGAIPAALISNSTAQQTNEHVVFVPHNTRASSSRLQSSTVESKPKVVNKNGRSQFDRDGDRNQSTNISPNGLTVGSSADALQDVSSKQRNANLVSPSKNGDVPNNAISSIKKGKKRAKGFEPVVLTSELADWDGKIIQPPVGDEWDRRNPFDPRGHERLSVIEAWREEHAADPEEKNRLTINTASLDFQNGEGLAGGYVNVLSPIDKMHHETHAPNDDFTQARRHQNAAAAIKDYEAKIAAKPKRISSGIESMTKQEKRDLRRALIEEERTRVDPPNPHAPAANIYLRPAEFKDMDQVKAIYNHYVREASFVHHLEPVDELYWRSRLQEAQNERNPFVVAIHLGEKFYRRQEDIIRKKQENVVGFTVAADYGGKHTLFHSTVELELMVDPKFHRQGIGRTLLDRILGALSPDYHVLEGAPFLPHNDICYWIGGGSRQAKGIMVNILYSKDNEDSVAWRKQWLTKYEFQHVGTLPHVGVKAGKLVSMCQLMLGTSVEFEKGRR